MTKLGHIEIKDNKIIFVYHEMPEPKKLTNTTSFISARRYVLAMKEYKASKRSVEVGNEIEHISGNNAYIWVKFNIGSSLFSFKNNQPCEARIENNSVTITKII